jgi:hypothetical protein
MNNLEYEQFLNRTLNMIENVVNFIEIQGKHIVAYNKLLGVQQKLSEVSDREKQHELIDIMISLKFALVYLIDGKYDQTLNRIKTIRTKLYLIYGNVKKYNENNKD